MQRGDFVKISIIGIGGVGGYLAGYLKKYESGNLTLIARKDHKKALIEQGLYVESDALGTLHLQLPVVEDASQLPAQDVIFICVKADQLTEALENIKPIVTDGTILVPIMNGAEHKNVAAPHPSCGAYRGYGPVHQQ